VNERAQILLKSVGSSHSDSILGDCFISRYYLDDAEDFVRMDFTLADLDKNAPWRHFAIRRNFSDKTFPCLLERDISWMQEEEEVVVMIPNESQELKGKMVDVCFSAKRIKISIKGETTLDRELGGRIDPEESWWELKRGKGLEITFCKVGNVDWDLLLM